MTGQHFEIASTFTATPTTAALRATFAREGHAPNVHFTLYGQMTAFMLQPNHTGISGVVVLVRLEDWLRDGLKSGPIGTDATPRQRERLVSGSGEFVTALSTLSQTVPQVWVMVLPSHGWIATRHDLQALCRTYGNVVTARIRKLPVTVLDCPPFLLNGECDDHSTDRLGQMPYSQPAFDQLGEFLACQIECGWQQNAETVRSDPSESAQFEAYLAGLKVHVTLFNPTNGDRIHIHRLLRTAADFSLTGEKPYLLDEEVEQLVTSHTCLLISVKDRLSNYGPSGLIFFVTVDGDLVIDSLALSCVVLGKQVEFAMLAALSSYAAERGFRRIVFKYSQSRRNLSMRTFLELVGVSQTDVGYVVDVASVENRLKKVTASPGAWSTTMQISHEQYGIQHT